jgi:hypothetical protein
VLQISRFFEHDVVRGKSQQNCFHGGTTALIRLLSSLFCVDRCDEKTACTPLGFSNDPCVGTLIRVSFGPKSDKYSVVKIYITVLSLSVLNSKVYESCDRKITWHMNRKLNGNFSHYATTVERIIHHVEFIYLMIGRSTW